MRNWNTDTTRLKKNPRRYTIWQLEQLINYGLNGQKLNKKKLQKYWQELEIDPEKREFLAMLLWPNQS